MHQVLSLFFIQSLSTGFEYEEMGLPSKCVLVSVVDVPGMLQMNLCGFTGFLT